MRFYHRGQSPKAARYWQQVIEGRVPEASIPYLAHLMSKMDMELHLSPPRASKLGHYQVAFGGRPQSISINLDLSPERFVLTLVHELAHLVCHNEFGHRIKPHGSEWKRTFQMLMTPLLCEEVFTSGILPQVIRHLNSPKATSCVDADLHRTFERLDGKDYLTLDEIPEGSRFKLSTGRTFVKGEKRRTRYYCKELPRMRGYYIHGAIEVEMVEARKKAFSAK